jgi:hypothetical protein
MTSDPDPGHLTEEQMIELLRGPVRSTTGAAEHLPCGQCTPRVRQLQEQWFEVQAAIDEIDLPQGFQFPVLPRTLPRKRGWVASAGAWRIAAGIFLLIGAGAVSATTPFGARVLSWLGLQPDRTEVTVAPTAPPPTVQQDSRGARISFPVQGPVMDVDLVHRPAGGRIILHRAGGGTAQIEVSSDTGAELPLIRQGGVQIRNSPGSVAEYRIGVPATVQRVQVRADGRRLRSIASEQIRDGMEIELRQAF